MCLSLLGGSKLGKTHLKYAKCGLTSSIRGKNTTLTGYWAFCSSPVQRTGAQGDGGCLQRTPDEQMNKVWTCSLQEPTQQTDVASPQ